MPLDNPVIDAAEVDTTKELRFDATYKFGVAAEGNTITVTNAIVELI